MTTDGGNSWTTYGTGVSVSMNAVGFVNTNVGWAVGGFGKIIKTVDGVNTWVTQTRGVYVALYDVKFLDLYVGYVVGENGTTLNTTDGGTS